MKDTNFGNKLNNFFLTQYSESCNLSTAMKRKAFYSDSKNVVAFKIEVQIAYCHRGITFDLVNGEAACYSDDDKIVEDEGKLTREGKYRLDWFVEKKMQLSFSIHVATSRSIY